MTTLTANDCVILVPCGDTIATACEQSLRVLEQRGYTVRRVRGYAAIDMARNVIASAAIRDGFAKRFQPMIREHQNGHWYLGEDFAFCERARQAGFNIYADTSIRLWHFGNYAFGWEEAGNDVKRFATFNFQINAGDVP